MNRTVHLARTAAIALVAIVAAAGFVGSPAGRPGSPGPRAGDLRRARELYGRARLCERRGRLVEALDALDEAARLDPSAASPHQARAPLLLALGRTADAIAAGRKAVSLDPDDYATWYLLAHVWRAEGDPAAAREALARAFACPALRQDPQKLFQVGSELSALYEAGKALQKALAVYEGVAAAGAEDPAVAAEALESVARIARSLGRTDRAAAALAHARELYQSFDPLHARRLDYDLARLLADRGETAPALDRLDSYLETQPPGVEPYEFRSRLLRALGRDGEVVDSLRSAVARDAHNVTLKLLLADELAHSRRRPEAEAVYREVTAEDPEPAGYRGLFRLWAAGGRPGEVVDQLDRVLASAGKSSTDSARARAMLAALREDPDLVHKILPTVRRRLRAQDAPGTATQRALALLAAAAGDLDAAEELFRHCRAAPVPPAAETALYDGLLRVLWAADRPQAVAEICRQGLRDARTTNRLPFHTNLARALLMLGEPDQALAEVDRALPLADTPGRFRLRLFRIEIFRQAGRTGPAEAEGLALLHENPSGPEARDVRHLLSNVYSDVRAWDKAVDQLREILRADPDDPTANNDLGYLMADRGLDLREAEALIRKALRLDGERRTRSGRPDADGATANAAYVDSLGWVLYRRGHLEAARREMERAVALPDGAGDPLVWQHLAEVCLHQGAYARASAAWRTALRLYAADHRRKPDEQYRALRARMALLEWAAHPETWARSLGPAHHSPGL